MISYVGAGFLVIGFSLLVWVFGLFRKSSDVISIALAALADLRDPGLNDMNKEMVLQGHSKRLLKLFFAITLGCFAAVFPPVGLIWLVEQMGLISLSLVIETAASWEFLVTSTVLAVLCFWLCWKHGFGK